VTNEEKKKVTISLKLITYILNVMIAEVDIEGMFLNFVEIKQ